MSLLLLGGPMPTNDADAIIPGMSTSGPVDVNTMSVLQWNLYENDLIVTGIVSFRGNGGNGSETWNSTDVGFTFSIPGLTAGAPTFLGRIVSGEPPGGWSDFWSLETSGTAAITGSHTLYVEPGSPTVDQYSIGFQFQFGSAGGGPELHYDASEDKYSVPFFCMLTFGARVFFGDPDDAGTLGTSCLSHAQEVLTGYVNIGVAKVSGEGTAIDPTSVSIHMKTGEDQTTAPNTVYFSNANVHLKATTLVTLP